MPKHKDLKRLIRARMQKTGEAYTAARLHLVKNKAASTRSSSKYAATAGMSDASVNKATGRTWAQWVSLLDAAGSADKPHREIVRRVSAQGTRDWWSQMVTVGYERIRGLRERGQRRGGGYSASKSRTFPVSVARLFRAFQNETERRKWLPVKAALRSATPHKRMRMTWDDESIVVFEFTAKGAAKSAVAVGHEKLPDKAAVEAVKKAWAGYFDCLGQLLS
jgi:uncharacterized protein YndB with AHSA1/START domain